MSTERKSFLYYKSFYEPIKTLPDATLGKIFRAICEYQFYAKEPTDEDVLIPFEFTRYQLDEDKKKYENVVARNKNTAATRKPARRKKHQALPDSPVGETGNETHHGSPEIPAAQSGKTSNENDQSAPNDHDNDDVDDNDNDNDKAFKKEIKEKVSKRFVQPTVTQIAAYCTERKNGIQAQRFFDYYQSKGWKIGNTPMKDWRAAVRTWEAKNNSSAKSTLEDARQAGADQIAKMFGRSK